MPNLLGITNPVPGLDSANINRNMPVNPNDPRIQNAPDPSRVSRPDNRTERQDQGDSTGPGGALRYDSNFQTFLQKLANSPQLTQVLTQLLLGERSIVASGLGEGVAQEMSALLDMLQMSEGELLQFMQQQSAAGSRFNGALFTLLREAYSQSQSDGIRGDILQFLKRYSDFTSSGHIEGNLMRTLTQLTRAVPASYGSQLLNMAQQLGERFAQKDQSGALKLLQNAILPFLASYTEKTHDMGLSRSLISLLALDISRYENGSKEGLLQSFRQLNGHAALRARLGGLSDEALLRLIENSTFVRAGQEDQFANALTKAAAWAMQGKGGSEMQDAFRQIVSAFLVNESVYMPLNHMIIPMEWEGRMMFSELWVDPDTEDNMRRGRNTKDNTIRFLFKVDIQGLGFFDMVMASRGDTVELQVFCPDTVAPFAQKVQGDLAQILKDNGLKPNGVAVRRMEKPLTISSVFPKIFEGENSVNVKV